MKNFHKKSSQIKKKYSQTATNRSTAYSLTVKLQVSRILFMIIIIIIVIGCNLFIQLDLQCAKIECDMKIKVDL